MTEEKRDHFREVHGCGGNFQKGIKIQRVSSIAPERTTLRLQYGNANSNTYHKDTQNKQE